MSHSVFSKLTVKEAERLCAKETVAGWKAAAKKYSETEQAYDIWEPAAAKQFSELEKHEQRTWLGFGLVGEAFAETYLEVFGSALYNLDFGYSTEDIRHALDDLGIDHHACSIAVQKLLGTDRMAQTGSPIYIQTKMPDRKDKEHQANDGSRLPNFGLHALATTVRASAGKQARFIVVTFGKGIHYTLDNMACGLFEIINYDEMAKHADGNLVFWNRLREKFDIPVKRTELLIDED